MATEDQTKDILRSTYIITIIFLFAGAVIASLFLAGTLFFYPREQVYASQQLAFEIIDRAVTFLMGLITGIALYLGIRIGKGV